MVLERPGTPLTLVEREPPRPAAGEVLIRVAACGVCRTDLHVCDGELTHPTLPLVPGHEIVGTIVECGPGVAADAVGRRIGVPWLGHTCGECRECRGGRENLCERAVFTGYTRDGGYADYVTAEHRFCFPIPDRYGDLDAAPLLCAGLIGYRAYRMAGDAPRLGLYGFGAAAHILAQLAHHEGREVYAFTRPGDRAGQDFARTLGAVWASGSDQRPPVDLDAAILFAPVGELVPTALRAVGAGGTVVCAGIHMSDIPSFPYAWLWRERVIRSVANLTREDGHAFMHAIAAAPVATHVSEFPLPDANRALDGVRTGRIQGAAVLDLR